MTRASRRSRSSTGALWDLHQRHFGAEDSPTLVWSASAPAMNPTLPLDYLERMEAEDPVAYRSEVLGEFRAGVSTLLDAESIQACVMDDVRERAPEEGVRYTSFADPASGSGKDSFTVAISHLDGDTAVLDVVRAWKPPFNPSGVIAEAAELLKQYGLSETTGDRYAPGFVSEHFRTNGVTYRHSERNRSELYLELLPSVNAARVARAALAPHQKAVERMESTMEATRAKALSRSRRSPATRLRESVLWRPLHGANRRTQSPSGETGDPLQVRGDGTDRRVHWETEPQLPRLRR